MFGPRDLWIKLIIKDHTVEMCQLGDEKPAFLPSTLDAPIPNINT